jgi:polyphosphate kinase 2 (PPK2 family)
VGRLDEVDLSQKLGKKQYEKRLGAAQDRLEALRLQLAGLVGDGRLGPPVLALFEGWDASGKGGAIKRLTAELDHRHVRVASFSAPTHDEKRHHFLWRFFPKLPGWGGVAIFDRSWYGRVLVERVEGFASEAEWRRGYEEIVGLERSLVAEGTIIIKFWMHVSDDEQLKRFERREKEPLKRWKLTDEDWRNREKADAYREAIEDMFEHTSTDVAPWTIVPGDSKKFARVFVIEHVCERIEAGMRERLSEQELKAA